ncbi:TPA: RNA 2'-phosphotransferase [Candidatus Latescibacteria bacterium]|nr:RNA 2'-phosphotransferase [Candidatus Latescibacterota bacterium]
MPGPSSTVRLSKLLSLMLRHRPQEFDLDVDRHGFADLDAVLGALRKKDSQILLCDIENIVDGTDKKRFEIEDGRIRARYGHSFEVDLGLDPAEPPEALYKGVSAREVDGTLSNGLKPFDRQYVHLSYDPDVAAQLGRGGNAVIRIDSLAAHEAGVAFYDCGPTMLTEFVPADYLLLEREASPRAPREEHPRRPSSSRPSSPQVAEPAPAEDEKPKYGRRRTFRRR